MGMEEKNFKGLEEAREKRNFVRAAKIAEELGKSQEEIKQLRFQAIKQFIMEYRNPQGAMSLIKEYQLNQEELIHLLEEVRRELKERGFLERRQFDIQAMDYLTFERWIAQYIKKFQ